MRHLAAFLLLGSVATAASAEPPAPGVYGDVQLSAVTGDLGGAEIELIGFGAQARVELVICEGWCNEVIAAPVRMTDDGFAFEYAEHWYDENGALVSSPRYEALAMRIDDGLSLTVMPADPAADPITFFLPRIPERFGLAVAARED